MSLCEKSFWGMCKKFRSILKGSENSLIDRKKTASENPDFLSLFRE